MKRELKIKQFNKWSPIGPDDGYWKCSDMKCTQKAAHYRGVVMDMSSMQKSTEPDGKGKTPVKSSAVRLIQTACDAHMEKSSRDEQDDDGDEDD